MEAFSGKKLNRDWEGKDGSAKEKDERRERRERAIRRR